MDLDVWIAEELDKAPAPTSEQRGAVASLLSLSDEGRA